MASLGTYMGMMVVSAGGGSFSAIGNTMPDVNSGLTAGEVANGSRYNQAFVYKAQSKATATVEAPWGSGTSALASTADPVSQSVVFGWPVGGVTFGSALLDSFTVTAKASSFASVQASFVNQSDPTAGGGGGGGTTANPPLFQNITGSTLGGDGANLESWEVTWNNGLIPFYANSGSSYPAEYILGGVKANGKFVGEFTGNSELSVLLAACPTSGTVSFAGGATCGSASIGVTANDAFYVSWKINQSMTSATTEELAFQLISTDGTSPLTVS